jgi:hypothetical protein
VGKISRRPGRANRPPREVRYSTSRATQVTLNADGSRTIRLSPDASDSMRRYMTWAREDFKTRYGREMGPDDPVFYDPKCSVPTARSEMAFRTEMVSLMLDAGLPRDKVYATARTGMVVTTENLPLLDRRVVDEWEAAIDEFYALGEPDPLSVIAT